MYANSLKCFSVRGGGRWVEGVERGDVRVRAKGVCPPACVCVCVRARARARARADVCGRVRACAGVCGRACECIRVCVFVCAGL